jgi:hypothetical protein
MSLSNKILSLALTTLAAVNTGVGPRPSFSLEITAPQSTVVSGKQIAIQVILKNISKGELRLGKSIAENQADYLDHAAVRDERGNLLAKKEYDSDGAGGTGGMADISLMTVITYTLKPGEVLKESMDLTNIYDMSKVGKYTG